jgi:hypothetical protein
VGLFVLRVTDYSGTSQGQQKEEHPNTLRHVGTLVPLVPVHLFGQPDEEIPDALFACRLKLIVSDGFMKPSPNLDLRLAQRPAYSLDSHDLRPSCKHTGVADCEASEISRSCRRRIGRVLIRP